MWAFYGGGILALTVIVLMWGIGVTIDAWNVYWRKPPSEDQIRREMQRIEEVQRAADSNSPYTTQRPS